MLFIGLYPFKVWLFLGDLIRNGQPDLKVDPEITRVLFTEDMALVTESGERFKLLVEESGRICKRKK